MGKYLQDVMFTLPEIKRKGKTEAQIAEFYKQFAEAQEALRLIENLYNYHLPKKFATGHNVWRFIVTLTTDKERHFDFDFIGDVYKIYCFIDNNNIKLLTCEKRKGLLLDVVSAAIVRICENLNCQHEDFLKVTALIKQKGIALNEAYKAQKKSPDKKLAAQLWTIYNELETATFVKINNDRDELMLSIKICDCYFLKFDTIKWISDELLRVYVINESESYKRKKVTEDFYQLSTNGQIEYVPQTIQAIFDYGVELMKDLKTFDEGLEYIRKAEAMQHGKALNILLNLRAEPNERNLKTLMQQPDKRRLQKLRE